MFVDNDPSLYGKTATNLRRKRGIKAKQSKKQSTLCADFTSIVFRRCGFTFWCHLFHLWCRNVQGCALLAAFEHEYRPLEYCSSFHRPLHLAKCKSNVELWAFGAGFFVFLCIVAASANVFAVQISLTLWLFFGFRDYFVSNHTDRQAYSMSTDKK